MKNIGIACGLIFIPLWSYIYQADILSCASQQVCPHYVLLCSDWHNFPDALSKKQLTLLERFLITNKNKVYVIVEDIVSNENGSGYADCKGAKVPCKDGILSGLAQWCWAHTIRCVNVEFRFFRVMACLPLLYHRLPASYQAISDAIVLEDIILEAVNAHRSITGADTDALVAIKSLLNNIDYFKRSTFFQYCMHNNIHHHHQQAQLAKELLICDTGLIDHAIIKVLEEVKNIPLVVIISGGEHSKKVKQHLEKYHYKPYTILPSIKYTQWRATLPPPALDYYEFKRILDGVTCSLSSKLSLL